MDSETCVRHLQDHLQASGASRVVLVTPVTSVALIAVRHVHRALPPFVDGDPEHVEASWLHDGLGLLDEPLLHRPLRAPHHSVSPLGMVGSSHQLYGDDVLSRSALHRKPCGWRLLPGEVSLAHGGTLLLDAVDEFSSAALSLTLDALRDGHVDHVRSYGSARLPTRPRLVVATLHAGRDGGRDLPLSARAVSTMEKLVRSGFSVLDLRGAS